MFFHAPASSWSRVPPHGHGPAHAHPAWPQQAHYPAPLPARFVEPPRASTTPPALYVVLSFALMLVLAAMTSVFGSFAALALIDEAPADDDTTEVAPPAASIHTR